ncbi:MAG TPA: hypothetical protein DFR83_08445, partial [Deltaproteobacteria bacterium]|nr:hypothetical protein [Deltaproteobacteria bacterium]
MKTRRPTNPRSETTQPPSGRQRGVQRNGPGNAAAQDALQGQAAEATEANTGWFGAMGSTLSELFHLMGGGEGRDLSREGTITDPRGKGAVTVASAIEEARAADGSFAAFLMQRYGFQPRIDEHRAPDTDTLRVMVPGLNTPEPEASRRTALYADVQGQPMMHLHNGTYLDTQLPAPDQLDYASAALTRIGVQETELMRQLEALLSGALSGAEPSDVHAILYSDSTIGGTRAIANFRANEIRRRIAALPPSRRRSAREDVTAEVDALLREHLFVELHGNATGDLPAGPRYMVWTDTEDQMTHTELPWGGQLGRDGQNRDSDADAVYVDYDGPFSGGDAHNLAAGGIHVV